MRRGQMMSSEGEEKSACVLSKEIRIYFLLVFIKIEKKSRAINGDGRKRKILCSLCAAASREKQLNLVSSYVLKQQPVECMGEDILSVSRNHSRTPRRQQVLNSFLFLAWDSACFYPATSLLVWIKITKINVCLYKCFFLRGWNINSLCALCLPKIFTFSFDYKQ